MLEVNVGVSKGPPGDHVSADTDGEDGSGSGELLEQNGLGDHGSQVTNIEAGSWGPVVVSEHLLLLHLVHLHFVGKSSCLLRRMEKAVTNMMDSSFLPTFLASAPFLWMSSSIHFSQT